MKLSVVRPNPAPATGGGDLLSDGSVPLTANWDAGSFEIRSATFESDVATGTAPLVVASTTKVANLNSDLLDDQTGSYYLDTANFTNIDSGTNGFRLTLTTGVPGQTADVTGASTIYCSPYKSNKIALYTGSDWVLRETAEFSKALSGLTSGKPYDIFCYDNSGTPTLEFLAWTSDTVRATDITRQDGTLVKSGDATRRYLGTFYTTSATTTEDSLGNRYLWNYYNQIEKPMGVWEATNTWTYTTATVRQANNSTANQLNFVSGETEGSVSAWVYASSSNSSAGIGRTVGIGFDTTTTMTPGGSGAIMQSNATAASTRSGSSAVYCAAMARGRHYLAWLEWSAAAGVTTWYGDNGGSINYQSGIQGLIKC